MRSLHLALLSAVAVVSGQMTALLTLLAFSVVVTIGTVASATHVPIGIDVPVLRPDEGAYLEFINPTEHPGLIGVPVHFQGLGSNNAGATRLTPGLSMQLR